MYMGIYERRFFILMSDIIRPAASCDLF